MTLGAPILSPARMQLRTLAFFAYWSEESDLDTFLRSTALGHTLSSGWHLRLAFLRRWGRFSEFEDLTEPNENVDVKTPVVAVTLARLKLPELFRFTRWGKPVEEQVRDHPGKTLALAAFRPPRTFSTFSIWKSQQLMTEMVHGQGAYPGAALHANAMKERERRDFHHEFITLRFRILSERGNWLGQWLTPPNS